MAHNLTISKRFWVILIKVEDENECIEILSVEVVYQCNGLILFIIDGGHHLKEGTSK